MTTNGSNVVRYTYNTNNAKETCSFIARYTYLFSWFIIAVVAAAAASSSLNAITFGKEYSCCECTYV